MFGPNTKKKIDQNVETSHRSRSFRILYKDLTQRFKQIFGLEGWSVLFLNGSGTLGIESVIRSVKFNVKTIGHEGRFTKRWAQMCQAYKNPNTKREESLSCLLETSVSSFFESDNLIVDGVSAFPFKPIPKEAKIFITSSNKILGSISGLSIVCIKDAALIKEDLTFSYLNLFLHLQASSKNETLTTASDATYKDFYESMNKLNIEKTIRKIKTNSKLISEAIGKEKITGESVCPVITVQKKHIHPKVSQKYDFYDGEDKWHIFTYSEEEESYMKLRKDLMKWS